MVCNDLRQMGVDQFIRFLRDALCLNLGECHSIERIVLQEVAALNYTVAAPREDFAIGEFGMFRLHFRTLPIFTGLYEGSGLA